jgi:hypothetical protein
MSRRSSFICFVCATLVALAPGALPAPALAQGRAIPRPPAGEAWSGRAGFDNGYREGLSSGLRDGRTGRAFYFRGDRVYQRADAGYRGYGNRNEYRAAFKQGFESGYRSGYERGRQARYGRGGSIYDPRGGYPDPRYGGYPGGYSRDLAWDRGYRDGYERGQNATRGNNRYDPVRERDYRDGDNGYDRRYGSKDAYKQLYREGFRAGYDRGYREGPYVSRRW